MSSMEMMLIMLLIGTFSAYFGKYRSDKRNEERAASPVVIRAGELARERMTALLDPNETLLDLTPMHSDVYHHWAVSDQRIFIEGKKGLEIIPREQVKKLSMLDFGSRKTKVPDLCSSLTIQTLDKKKHTLYNSGPTFAHCVRILVEG